MRALQVCSIIVFSLPALALAQNCADKIVLAAAKENVAKVFGDRPESGGVCALGVRESLQLSGVGGVTEGLGNAIDYLQSLLEHGFIDSGLRDPNTAPPGAIIVFAGPHSDQYLKDGKFGSPPGDWLGHVTIKGDDQFYYTDARTVEPAIGWTNGKNVEAVRDVAGIFVPDAALIAQYADKCSKNTEGITMIRLPLILTVMLTTSTSSLSAAEKNCPLCDATEKSTRDFHSLNYRDTDDHRKGRRLIRSALDQFHEFTKLSASQPDRLAVFRSLLALGREAGPYDGEGQLTQMLAKKINDDTALHAEFDNYVQSLGKPDCKTERLTSAISEAICMKGLGMEGQDFAGKKAPGHAGACISKFNYDACLNEKGL